MCKTTVLNIAVSVLCLGGSVAAKAQVLGLSDEGIHFPDGTLLTSAGGSYANVVTVAKSGGHHTSIQAAIDSIDDASSANAYLLFVGPGIYDEQVFMKAWVDIQGSGQNATRLVNSSGDVALVTAADAELRHLTVEADNGIAISAAGLGWRPQISHVRVNVINSGTGIWGWFGEGTIEDSVIVVSGGPGSNRGISKSGSLAEPVGGTIRNVSIQVSGGSSNSGIVGYGGIVEIERTRIVVDGPPGSSRIGLSWSSGDVEVRDSQILVQDQGPMDESAFGVVVFSEGNRRLQNCLVDAGEGFALWSDLTGGPLQVLHSQVVGEVNNASGQVECFSVCDGGLVARASDCS